MALWLKPKYKPFTGIFFTLFNMDRTQMVITSKTKLPSSNLTVVDGAAILGLEFEMPGNRPKLSNEFNFVARAIPYLKGKFQGAHHEFDAFPLLRSDNLKWLKLEKAVARAMTNNIELNKKLGERWTFLSNSFFKHEQADLKLNPQVVPRVKRETEQSLMMKMLKNGHKARVFKHHKQPCSQVTGLFCSKNWSDTEQYFPSTNLVHQTSCLCLMMDCCAFKRNQARKI